MPGADLFLPRAADAVVPADKLRDYSLNSDHPQGRHKARVFLSVLGLRASDCEYLRDQILNRVGDCPSPRLG